MTDQLDGITVEFSPSIAALAQALAEASVKFPVISKRRTAKIKPRDKAEYSYKYADLADVREASVPVLAKAGLAVIAVPCIRDGKPALCTTLAHTSGEWVRGTMDLLITQPSAQAQGSAITYARRYMVSAMLNLVTEDDDGRAATQEANGRRVAAPQTVTRAEGGNRLADLTDLLDRHGAPKPLRGRLDTLAGILDREVKSMRDLTDADIDAVFAQLEPDDTAAVPTEGYGHSEEPFDV